MDKMKSTYLVIILHFYRLYKNPITLNRSILGFYFLNILIIILKLFQVLTDLSNRIDLYEHF